MKNSRSWIVIVIIAVIIVVAVALYVHHERYNTSMSESTTSMTTSSDMMASSTTSTAAAVTQTSPVGTLTYSEAVRYYGNNRIQFNASCQALPAAITVKNGTSMMFDNRSSAARIITVDGIRHNVPGYGFIVLQLTHSQLPYTMDVECNSSANNGKITLQ